MTQPFEAALAHLRQRFVGVLVYDLTPLPSRFVLDTASGRPVLPVPHAVLEAEEHVLFVPDEGEGSLQLLTIPEPIEPGEATDRWAAYHGAARLPAWVRLAIDCARLGGRVLDGADLMIPNTLAGAQASLCRSLNQRRDALASLVARTHGVQVQDALAVGVDQFGIDVRTRLDVFHVPFPDSAADASHAESIIEPLLSGHDP